MKVSVLINSLSCGGAERVAENLIKKLSVNNVYIFENKVFYDIPKEKIILLSNKKVKKTNGFWESIKIIFYCFKIIYFNDKSNCIISFLERSNYVNVLSSFFTKHKTIITIHMSQINGRPKLHPYNIISKILYPKANKVVVVSRGIKNELINYYGVNENKIKVIYNPIIYEDILYLKNEDLNEYKNIFENNTLLVNVGRLSKPKGQWYLLRIFNELKKSNTNLKLAIIGDGELKDYLIKLSKDLNLKTYVWDSNKLSEDYNVYFLGFQKNPYKFIAKSKIFIFTSLWEGFGNVLIESMACGVPIISADCISGPREVLAPNTDINYQTKKPEYAKYGILLPPFEIKYKSYLDPLDEKEKIWIDFIEKTINNTEILNNYAKKSIERAIDFDINNIIEEWKEILHER